MTRLYLSSHDTQLARASAAQLRTAGFAVQSTWHEVSTEDKGFARTPDEWTETISKRNFPQIEKADALVLFAGDGRYTGGKFVEAGFALARDKAIYVIGRVENNMLYHKNVKLFGTLSSLIEHLKDA